MSERTNAGAVNCSEEDMDAVILARKIQKKLALKEKLQKDWEKIEYGSKAKSNAEADDGFSDPREILPVEMWDKIFTFVSEPEDVVNSGKTCSLFFGIVKRQNPLLLLPEVLSILREREYMTKRDKISRIRQVSKWFRFSYDRTYFEKRFLEENWHIKYDEASEIYKFGTLDLRWGLPIHHSLQLVRQFINEFGSTPVPKVWTRSVKFVFEESKYSYKPKNISRALDRFFALFGSSIWSFTVEVKLEPFTLNGFYTRLHAWASHLPNLKVLRVKVHLIGWENSEDCVVRLNEVYQSRDIKRLQEVPAFPVIPSLRVCLGGDNPFSLFTERILKSNPWIKHLGTVPRFKEDEANHILKDLEIEVFDNRAYRLEDQPPLRLLLQVYKSAECDWFLKKIVLRVNFRQGGAPDLFRFLEGFKETLEWVSLEFLAKYDDDGDEETTIIPVNSLLDLPNVKHFRLHGFPTYFPFRILNSMAFLEKLDIGAYFPNRKWKADPYAQSSYDFYPCFFKNGMQDCYIWKYFPYLKEVRFNYCGYRVHPRVKKFEKKGGVVHWEVYYTQYEE